MIVRANITKVINGKLYLKVRDEAEMWDILDNELYTDDDVIWEESYNEPVYTEDVDPVRFCRINGEILAVKFDPAREEAR